MRCSEHHCTQGCSSHWGFAILASSGTLGSISPPGLRAEAPQGASPPGLQDFGVAEQFPDGGKGLGAEPGQGWLGTGRSARASESRLDGRADGPSSRAMARGCRDGAAEETGLRGPAGSRCRPGNHRPDPVPQLPPGAWRLAGPGRRVGAGRCRLPELPLFAFNQDVSGRIKSTNWGNHHHKKSCACKIGQVRLQRERVSDLHCKEE